MTSYGAGGSPPYSELAHLFLEVRTQMKLYHWQTRSYARHKATDRFIETFEPLVDRFVETAQGILTAEAPLDPSSPTDDDQRIENYGHLTSQQQRVVAAFSGPVSDDNAKEFLSKFSIFMSNVKLPQSELAQIRDDMLEITAVTLYLFTLKCGTFLRYVLLTLRA